MPNTLLLDAPDFQTFCYPCVMFEFSCNFASFPIISVENWYQQFFRVFFKRACTRGLGQFFFVLSSTYNKDNCLLALQISNKRVLPNSHHPKLCLSKNNLIQRCNPPADKTLPLAQLSNYFEHAFMEIKSCSDVLV